MRAVPSHRLLGSQTLFPACKCAVWILAVHRCAGHSSGAQLHVRKRPTAKHRTFGGRHLRPGAAVCWVPKWRTFVRADAHKCALWRRFGRWLYPCMQACMWVQGLACCACQPSQQHTQAMGPAHLARPAPAAVVAAAVVAAAAPALAPAAGTQSGTLGFGCGWRLGHQWA